MFASAALLAALVAVVPAYARLTLSVTGPKAVDSVDNLSVTATLTNTGKETLRLLSDPSSVLTPDWQAKTFDIETIDGVTPKFNGLKAKWSAKLAAENGLYVTFAPGQSVTLEHDLAGLYNFTSSGEGAYYFSAANDIFTHVNEDGSLVEMRAETATPHTVSVAGQLAPKVKAGTMQALSKRITYRSCTAARQTLLATAATNAQTYASSTYTYVSGISSGTARYTTWFGTYTTSRKNSVQSHFSNIMNGQLATDTFDCTCTDAGTYAYVYPDTFGVIYLCGAFWNAPATGTDSKAGTLIHESSHFTRNGGTDDYTYGQTNCKALAKSNPDEAVFNADSHEYFAENTPAQA